MDPIIIEGAKVLFRNFSGRETEYNREGRKNFSVIIDDEATAQELANQGWYIRQLADKEDPNRVTYIMQIKINFDSMRPPKVCLVAPNGKITDLNDETIGLLDQADIRYVDVEANPYEWNSNGKSGVTAYLKTMYAVIEEDAFAAKYAQEESPTEDDIESPDELPFN